jgi:hypothetical protein
MLRRLSISLLAAVVAASIGLSLSGSYADDTPPSTSAWSYPTVCADGALEGQAANPTAITINLTGWVRPCADADPAAVARARFARANYFSNYAGVHAATAQPFNPAPDTTGVAATMRLGGSGLETGVAGTLQASCLVTGASARIACVAIGPLDASGLPYVTPIPVDDPRVARPVQVVPLSTPEPECIGCV